MQVTEGSEISELSLLSGENFTREDKLLTYSEEEKQDNEIAKENAKLIFSPKFIPVYPQLLDKLTPTEAILF